VPTLFDHLLAVTSLLAECLLSGGLLTLCGDVLPLFPSIDFSFPADGAAVVTTPTTLDIARRHGVIVSDSLGHVVNLVQKAPPDEIVAAGALDGGALLDTGIIAFLGDAFADLLRLARSRPDPLNEVICSEQEYSLYEHVVAAMVPGMHDWLKRKPLGERLIQHLGAHVLHELRAPGMAFVHLGSMSEILDHLGRPWDGRLSRRILAETGPGVAESALSYVSRLASSAQVGGQSLVFGSHLGDGARVGNRCVTIGLDDGGRDFLLPDNCCLWQVPISSAGSACGELVLACCGIDDDPKSAFEDATFCNRGFSLWLAEHEVPPEAIWLPGDERILWHARLFPAEPLCEKYSAVDWILGNKRGDPSVRERWHSSRRYSMADLHALADVDAFLKWENEVTASLVRAIAPRYVICDNWDVRFVVYIR
jgi:fucokinase